MSGFAVDAKKLFLEALTQATVIIDQVDPADFLKPTPNTEWNVRKLASHMLYELCWVSDILSGKTIDEVGTVYDGDLIGPHGLEANWHAAAQMAKDALSECKTQQIVHLSAGDVPAETYLRQIGTDLLIHAWDLGEAIGQSVQFDPEVAEAVYEYLQEYAPAMHAAGLFGQPIETPEDTSVQIKVLALSGRPIEWRRD